jgi:tRNA-specific 2-thiouridylase
MEIARSSPAKDRRKVLVAMSGGVDSSVAACLLHERGYDVVGVFMRLGAQDDRESDACELPVSRLRLPVLSASPEDGRHHGCCSAADAGDARQVAGRLGIPFYALNFEDEFNRLIDYFADEYAAARTPNPCVRCNQWLKFGRLVEYADAIGADLIATGHYARLEQDGPRPRLFRARHHAKDQSYVLFGLSPDVLARTLFPLGELTKDEVRREARRFGLALHDKPESQDLCFAARGDYARIIRQRRPDALRTGELRHVDGRLLGRHDGVPKFTIGQRRGLGVATGSPVYVASLDADTATVMVGPEDAVRSVTLRASGISWLSDAPRGTFRADVRIRYNHGAAPAEVAHTSDNGVTVRFDAPQWAVTPGQAVVFYRDDEVLGGGWIDGQ